tara:strand:+ start:465 stop:2048 length:1584 start_codon:yes stop_codon:yes gene_type:complete
MGRTLRKRTFLKKGKKITKKRKKKLNIRSKGTLIKKKFTKKKKRKKKLNIKSSRKYKGGFWTTCDKCMRRKNCIGRACMNDCGYCTIQAFELPGINELFRDHQYYEGLSEQAFIRRVNQWLINKDYHNLTVMENTIGSDKPQPSQVAKFLRDNGGDNEFIPICLGWPGDGVAGHWLVGGRVNGKAVIIEPQQNPNKMEEKDFEAYAYQNHQDNPQVTIGPIEEKNLGLAQAKIYVWEQRSMDFLEQNTNEKYFGEGTPLSRLTYYTIVGKDGDQNIEHKIIKTGNGIEIRVRESDGNGNVTVGQRVKRGHRYQLEEEESSGETKSNNNTLKCYFCNESKPPDQFLKNQKSKGSRRKCNRCINSKSETNPNPESKPKPSSSSSSSPLPSSHITNMKQVDPRLGAVGEKFPVWDLYCGRCNAMMVKCNHTPGTHSCDSCYKNIYNTCVCCPADCDIDYCQMCICFFCGENWKQHADGSTCVPLIKIPKPRLWSGFGNLCQNCGLGQSYHFNYNNTTWCPYTFHPYGNNS